MFKRNAKKTKEDTGWIVVEKDGTIRKARPEEVPKEGELVAGEGCSPENGIPVIPILNGRVRKRAKRKT